MAILLLLLFLFGCSAAPPEPTLESTTKPIVGGWVADIAVWPWYVSLRHTGGHYCGGVLVAPDVVLTAAHCAHAGLYARTEDGAAAWVAQWVVHPLYNETAFGAYDYALGRLSAPLPAPVARLNAEHDRPYPREHLWTAGRGRTEDGTMPERLLETAVGEVPYARCLDYYPMEDLDRLTQICAGYVGQGVCSGDSGGPLVDDDGVVVGIVSWGRSSCEGAPMVFMRTSMAYDWVYANL